MLQHHQKYYNNTKSATKIQKIIQKDYKEQQKYYKNQYIQQKYNKKQKYYNNTKNNTTIPKILQKHKK